MTLARAASNTFAGIRPLAAPGFSVAQLLGIFVATGLFRWLIPTLPARPENVMLPHSDPQ